MHKTPVFHLLIPALLVASAVSPAAAQQPLTLDAAIARALKQNPAVRSADAGASEAAARTRQARAGWLPRVEVSETWQRGNHPVYVFGSLLTQRRFTQSDFSLDALNHPDAQPNYRAAVALEQVLFDGTRTLAAVRSSRIGEELAAVGSRDVASALRVGVTQTFGHTLMAQAQRQAAEAAVASATEDLRRIERRRDGGMATDADVLALEVHLAQMRARLISATSDETIARARLNDAMGEPLDAAFVLEATPAAATDAPTVSLAALETDALATRPEVLRARAQERLADQGITMARAGFLPQAAVQAVYEGNGHTVSDRAASWTVGAVLRWNVFAGFSDNARLAEARAARDRARSERERAESQIRVDVRAAAAAVEASRARADVGRSVVAQAREHQRMTRDRYEAGLAGVNDLLRSANAVLEAELLHTATSVDVVVSAAMLERARGK